MQMIKILGRSLVDCFCSYVGPMLSDAAFQPAADDAPEALAAFQKAVEMINALNLPSARRQLESALAAENQMPAARLLMAAVLNDLGYSRQARTVLEELAGQFPEDGRLAYLLGQLTERCGEVERALHHYEYAMTRPGRSSCESAERLAAIYLATDDFARARDTLRWLADAQPEEFLVRMELAGVLSQLGETEAAIRVYEDAILLDPDNWEARKDLASALEAEGRLSEALAELRLVLDEHPHFADLQLRAAKISGRMGDIDGAIRHAGAALEGNPRYLEAIVFKGLLLTHQGRHDAAIATFQRALDVNDDYVVAYAGLAMALHQAGREQESNDVMELARKVAPGSEQIYAKLAETGLASVMAGQQPSAAGQKLPGGNRFAGQAIGQGQPTARDQANRMPTWQGRNRISALSGSDDELAEFEGRSPGKCAEADDCERRSAHQAQSQFQSSQASPSSDGTHDELGAEADFASPGNEPAPAAECENGPSAECENGPSAECEAASSAECQAGSSAAPANHDAKLRQQLKLHRQAVERSPNYADLRYCYGLLLSSLGRSREALEQYKAAVEINPCYVEAQVRLALCYWQMNRPEEARRWLETAQRQSPETLKTHYKFGLLWADHGLWPLAMESSRRRAPATGQKMPGALAAAMQNLGVADSQLQGYLSSLSLVDQRDHRRRAPMKQ